ncbi:uncharacterized protein LOC117120148 isoform X3 [Anneissia japonica]|uniref:uncharacterized protein LOC117120148 isoform X3 n=1 Tax=Anneissia japonica TaxID=1529436 RepID=UPI001425B459|nr:uncharacterized protein LOC117120148 isoform X3 [Anneissia japonica]
MDRLTKCILVLAWKIAVVGAQCPSGFACSGPSCILIYPTSNGWKYRNTNGDIRIAALGNVSTSPNCYKFIRVNRKGQSCVDAQRECEQAGGNITEINSIDEYERLTKNVLNIISVLEVSTFSVHVINLPLDHIRIGCATITVQDGYFFNNLNIKNTHCTTTHMVNTIFCEHTDVHTGICSMPGATEKMLKPTISVHQTSHIWSRNGKPVDKVEYQDYV